MHTLSIKLPAELHAAIDSEARRRNVTRSALLRDIVEKGLDGLPEPAAPNCADLMSDLIGSVDSGHDDLATNPRFLEEAIVADSGRGPATIRARATADRRR